MVLQGYIRLAYDLIRCENFSALFLDQDAELFDAVQKVSFGLPCGNSHQDRSINP